MKLLPDGPYAFEACQFSLFCFYDISPFQISLLDGLTKSVSATFADPFNEVSYRLIHFAGVALFQLFYAFLHILLKAGSKKKNQQKTQKRGGDDTSCYSVG